MRLILKLLLAQCRRHWLRTLLAVAALTTSVAMVIVVVGGYDLAFAEAKQKAGRASDVLGRFDMLARYGDPTEAEADRRRGGASAPAPAIHDDVIAWLRQREDVREVMQGSAARVECCASGPMFRYAMYRPGQMMRCDLTAVTAETPPQKLIEGAWVGQLTDGEVVIDTNMARRLRGEVGGTFQMSTITGRHEVTIGGIIDCPMPIWGFMNVYTTPKTIEALIGQPPVTNRLFVALADAEAVEDIGDELAGVARRAGTPVHMQTAADFAEEIERWAAMGRRRRGGFFPLLRNAEMNLAIIAALFVIFNTFNMSLQERTRQLGMLRAIGMTRRQVVGLIAVEAFVLALVGWLAGVGVGHYLMRESAARLAATRGSDLSIHTGLWWGLGALAAFGATFLAAVLPAVMAARRRPLEAMEGVPLMRSSRWPRWLPVLGLALILLNPLTTWFELPEPWGSRLILPLSFIAALGGFVLLLPLTIVTCERLFGRISGAMFGLDHRLVSKQLSANLWRVVGCVSALMVGLGLYVTIQIWGQSMMVPFLVSERSPDAVVTVFPDGVPAEKIPDIRQLPGVQAALPMVLEHPALAELPEGLEAGGIFSRDLIYVGTDVKAMIGEGGGMIGASLVRGNASEAYQRLNRGGYCLITDSLYLRSPEHYDVGQSIVLDTVDPPRRKLTYTIAGVVEMRGWHLLTKSAQMRRGLGRVGGIVMVSTGEAKFAYPKAGFRTFWLSLAPGTDAAALHHPIVNILDPDAKPIARPRPRVGNGPATAGMGPRGDRGEGRRGGSPRSAKGFRAVAPLDSNVYCRVTDTAAMTAAIRRRSEGIIEAMTFYPLLALALASLAVVNTMVISVRARNWELGILRSLGLTRWQLLRQVLAEGLLIGLLACLISVSFGLLAAWSGILQTSKAFGVTAPFIVPWKPLTLGMGAAVILCIAASIVPAVWTACRNPLRLLQEGRTTE